MCKELYTCEHSLVGKVRRGDVVADVARCMAGSLQAPDSQLTNLPAHSKVMT